MSTKRPKLVPGHTYRFTFTPAEWAPCQTPYSTVVTVVEPPSYGDKTPKALTMWANRWCARGKHTVEIVEVPTPSVLHIDDVDVD